MVLFGLYYVCLVLFGERKWPRYIGVCGKSGRGKSGFYYIWKSKLSKSLKIRLFIATCESVLLYGSETWTLTKAQEKSLDGTYTKMLRMVLGISWKDKVSNITLYDSLPRLSNKLRSRRLKMAGNCISHPELLASDLFLWEPMQYAW